MPGLGPPTLEVLAAGGTNILDFRTGVAGGSTHVVSDLLGCVTL
jgi:hypothetical protein